MIIRNESRDYCILSWLSGSMTVTHDQYDPSKIGDPQLTHCQLSSGYLKTSRNPKCELSN